MEVDVAVARDRSITEDPRTRSSACSARSSPPATSTNRLVAADGDAPAQLVIPLVADDGGEATVLLCFLPEHDYPRSCSTWSPLEYDVAPAAVETTARFLHLVNSQPPADRVRAR